MRNALRIGTFLFLSSVSSFALSAQCIDTDQPVHVSAVYPTADTLPENLLRFYIYFNRPMKTENTLDNVYLTDDSGQRLEGVFLENKFNLWSPDRTRLTLLFDPGRVKTGLVAHNTFGRALRAGQKYHLVIDASAINKLDCTSTHTKTFKVDQANYAKPTVSDWVLNQPQSHSRMPLTVDFKSPIDHTSLAFRIRVKNASGDTVAGAIDLGKEEKQWIFTPNQAWDAKESYRLFVNPVLEDIAGNRPTGLFDQPSLSEETKHQDKYIEIPIVVNN